MGCHPEISNAKCMTDYLLYRSICIIDARDGRMQAAQTICNAHQAAVNRIMWHPADAHFLLSAASDPNIHLFDIRQAATPLITFSGHIQGR